MKKYLIAIAALFLAWQQWSSRSQYQPEGMLVADIPEQQILDDAESFDFNGYRITPLATFDLQGRVLSRKDYRFGREAELAPVDIAFGWGRMSDSAVLAKIDISQGNRFYRWQTREPPIPLREIEMSSANMHLIPADDSVKYAMEDAREGQLVKLTGQLVRVDAKDGWRWKSSLTRNDTGGGACELIYVETFYAE